ncbi:motility associated factor glycosyltransferase family protein [Clostridium sp. Mt-5]|uniref:Motility associated factor glycosyltransferase family protein n=1 Tax=Clostridium moutaii TaxID=3240932 RepID=A0ABV4BJ40_9CLOT
MNCITENTVNYIHRLKSSLSYDNCRIEFSKDSKKIIRFKKGDKYIYIGSKYNVNRDINNILDKLVNINSQNLIIIFGLGAGEYIKPLLESVKDENRILIVEPSLEIIKLFLDEDYCNLLSDERIYLTHFEKGLENFLYSFIKINDLYNMTPIVYAGYDKIFSAECIEFFHCLNKVRSNLLIEFNTSLSISRSIFYSTIKNMYCISNSIPINNLKKIYEGMTAIVISAGPSLEKNIDQLKQLQKNFILISGLRNLKGLLKIGVFPDFVCILDALDINYEFIKDCINLNIPMVFHEASNYKVINSYKGPKILFLHNTKLSEFLCKKIDSLYQGGSVAHICTSFAAYIGCSTIIFIGQDLAYTDDKFHAGAASFGDEIKDYKLEEKYTLTDDIYGNKIKTDSVFNLFREKLEDFIEYNKDITFINSTEGGANIRGTQVMPLKDSGKVYGKNGKDKRILKSIMDSEENRLDGKKIKEFLLNNKKSLEYMIKKIKKDKKFIDNLYLYYNENSNININKTMDELDKLDRFIQKNCDEFILINDLLEPVILETMYRKDMIVFSEDKEIDKGKKIAKKYKILYENIEKGINFAIPLFEASIEKF